MLRWFCLYILLISPLTLQAQIIRGRVLDAETHAPLPGAQVVLPEFQMGTITDTLGLFNMKVPRPGAYRLMIRFVGYQTVTRLVEVTDTTTLEILLQPTVIETEPVVVTARSLPTDILSVPQSITTLTTRQLEQRISTSMLDALQDIPGVQLLRVSPFLSKPVLRGLSGQRILILDNGIRLEDQQWGDEHAPELDPLATGKIEVLKGPASLLYGSDALGGVIQVLNTDLFEYHTPLTASLHLQGMTNPQLGSIGIRAGGKQRKLFYDSSIGLRRASSYRTPDDWLPNTAFTNSTWTLRTGLINRDDEYLLSYRGFHSRVGFWEPDMALSPTPSFAIGPPYQTIDHHRVKGEFRTSLQQNRLEILTGWQQNDRREFEEDGLALHLRLRTLTLDTRLHHRPIGHLFGTVGLSGMYQRNQTLGPETLIPAATTWNGALFLTETLLLDKLTLDAGVRIDTRLLQAEATPALDLQPQQTTYTAVSAATDASWRFTQTGSFALNIGRAWRAPSLFELYANGVHEGTFRFEKGNPDLKPEQSLNMDALIQYFGRHTHVELSAYLNLLDPFIYLHQTNKRDPETGYFVFEYRQARSRIYGLEATLDVHPHPWDWLHLQLSGDITRTYNTKTRTALPLTPPPRISGEIEVERGTLHLTFGITHVMRQTQTAPEETPSQPYTVSRLQLTTETTGEEGHTLSLVFSVENLFNRRYIPHLSLLKPYGIPAPGRSLQAKIRFSF